MSFVRIGSFEANPEKAEELIRIFEHEVQPAMRAAVGNLSACLLREHGETSRFLACTAWRTREDAERYEQSGLAQQNVSKLRHAFAGAPTLVTYDGFGG